MGERVLSHGSSEDILPPPRCSCGRACVLRITGDPPRQFWQCPFHFDPEGKAGVQGKETVGFVPLRSSKGIHL